MGVCELVEFNVVCYKKGNALLPNQDILYELSVFLTKSRNFLYF